MKIAITPTLTGRWYELVEPITADDVTVKLHDPGWSEAGKCVSTSISVSVKPEAIAPFVASIPERDLYSVQRKFGLDRSDAKLYAYRRIDTPVQTRGCAADTRDLRIDAAITSDRDRYTGSPSWVNAMTAELIDELNDRVRRHLAELNSGPLEAISQNLRSNTGWRKEAEGQVQPGLVAARDALLASIETMRQQARALETQIRAELPRAFLSVLDAEGWVVEEDGVETRMPNDYITAFREAVRKDGAWDTHNPFGIV